MKRTLVMALAMLALAGCSGGSAKAAEVKPSPTPSTATITQYASLMNGPLRDFQKTWDAYAQQCLFEQNDSNCKVAPTTLNASASVIQLKLESAVKPTSPVYIGPPPTELVRLVQTTHDDAARVVADTADKKHPSDMMGSDCRSLTSDVDAWVPYLS